MSIFKNLPNDLIMRIIREADGGLYTHKKKARMSIKEIQSVGSLYRSEWNNFIGHRSVSGFLCTFTQLYKFTKSADANVIRSLNGGHLPSSSSDDDSSSDDSSSDDDY